MKASENVCNFALQLRFSHFFYDDPLRRAKEGHTDCSKHFLAGRSFQACLSQRKLRTSAEKAFE